MEDICMNKEKALDVLRELTTPKEVTYDENGSMIPRMEYSFEEYQEAVKVFSDIVSQNNEMEDWIEVLKKEAAFYKEEAEQKEKLNIVTVRWWDGYMEVFEATEVIFGSDLLWMRLKDGNNRHIPMRQVRWFGTSIESHQNTGMQVEFEAHEQLHDGRNI